VVSRVAAGVSTYLDKVKLEAKKKQMRGKDGFKEDEDVDEVSELS
jgi:hypothetical protein